MISNQTVNQRIKQLINNQRTNKYDEYVKYWAEDMKEMNSKKKGEVITKKRRGIGAICPICANQNRADPYSE